MFHNLANFIITGAIPFVLLLCLNYKTYLAIRDSLKTQSQLRRNRSRHSRDNLGEEIHSPQDKDKEIVLSVVLFGFIIYSYAQLICVEC